MKKITLSIGIPAHNEEASILALLRAVNKQKHPNFTLEHIYVILDGCTDSTENIVRHEAKKNKKIQLINDGKRKGKAGRLNDIYQMNTSDYLLTLDADVMFGSPKEIQKLVTLLKNSKNKQVVIGNQVPVKPDSFIGMLIYVNHILWDNTRLLVPNGDHIANVFGACSLLKKDFAKSVTYPVKSTADEEFLYISAKKQNGYAYAFNTTIYYRVVTSLRDARIGIGRFSNERFSLVPVFGEQVVDLHHMDMKYKVKGLLKTFSKFPFLLILSTILNILIKKMPIRDPLNAKGQWIPLKSNKIAIEV